MKISPKILIIYNSKKNKNSFKIANKIKNKIKNCEILSTENKINLKKFDYIFIIAPNIGDEELPEPIESYLYSLKTENKKYFLCELCNSFGLDYKKGCGNIIVKLLDKLNWNKQLDICLDSFPKIDKKALKKWIITCKNIIN